MKKALIISLLLSITTVGFSQFTFDKRNNIDIYGNYISDCFLENLKGKVKTVKTLSFKASQKNDSIMEKKYYYPGEIGWVSYYDTQGNKTHKKKLADSLDFTKQNTAEKFVFQYELDKPKTIVKKDSKYNPSGEIYEYIYNEAGNITELLIKESDDNDDYYNSKFIFDKSSKQIVSIKTKSPKGKNSYKYGYKNLKNGNIEFIKYKDGQINEIIIFNGTGKIIEKKERHSQIISRSPIKTQAYYDSELYKYDSNGNIIEKTSKSERSLAKQKPVMIYKYTYDDNNNWIRKVAFEGDKIIYLDERIIEYYE